MKIDKQLLLQDLYARLPYGLKVKVCDTVYTPTLKGILGDNLFLQFDTKPIKNGDSTYNITEDNIKPYLRPMSSMTEEEITQVQTFMDIVTDENYGDGYSPSAWNAANGLVQYFDSHYLDHRGLIFKGLALEAPEGMY